MQPKALLRSAACVALTLGAANLWASNVHQETKRDTAAKIVGGQQLGQGERPWMVSLQYDGTHFCGGSLIAPDWVLTAAHCVDDGLTDGVQVLANFIDLDNSGSARNSDISEIHIHPDYNSNSPADIALLRLSQPIEDVAPLTRITEGEMNSFAPPGTMMSVSGWGDTREGGGAPTMLQSTNVPLVSRAQCNLPQSYNGEISETEICAGYQRGGKDSCQGDSGGPLVMLQQGIYYQTGVVSWGDGCARPDKYGVYARMASFNNWIESVQSNQLAPASGTTSTMVQNGKLTSGVAISALENEQGQRDTFYIDVTADAQILWIDIRGGSGDADLMVAFDRQPEWDDLDYAPYLDGNEEYVLIESPAPGRWHISVDGYLDYQNVELMVFTR